MNTTNLVTTNLVKNYGIMFLRKGTKLYHTSEEDKLFNTNNSDIKFLFCSFHPYDYGFNSKYVYIIELKKDIKLFFMIDKFNNNKTPKFHSSFSNLLYFSKKNLSYLKLNKRKNNKNKFDKFTNILEKQKFDGWFSSINDYGYNLEVALFNGKSLYNIIQRDNININMNINNTNYTKTNFSISTINYPIKLIINNKYKYNIDNILNKFKNKNYEPSTIFEIIISNAEIFYFDENNHIINANNAFKKYI